MTNMLFTNVRIIDGSGAPPFAGDVLVQGNRILRVGRGTRSIPTVGATVIDGAGATLMPGMVEAHTHFSWNDSATLEGIQRMPLEEHVLWSADVARRYLEAGFTSCVGAACAKPRLDVVTRNAINEGLIPGPRYLATRCCRICRSPSSASASW
jgi:imidazolonepropionase-like amidohydrolase